MTPRTSKSDPYPPAIVMHLNVLLFHREHNTCVWQMMLNHLNCFNEEQGEISFGVLGRAMGGAPTGRDIDTTRRLYVMSNVIRRYMLNFQDDLGHLDQIRYYFTVTPEMDEVQAVGDRMITLIEDLAVNRFTWYEGTKASFKTLQQGLAHQEHRLEVEPLFKDDINDAYQKLYKKAKKMTHSRWLEQFPGVWPEVLRPDPLDPDIAIDADEHGRDSKTGRSRRNKRRRTRTV